MPMMNIAEDRRIEESTYNCQRPHNNRRDQWTKAPENEKKETWDNPYDKLENSLERILGLQKKRNNLEREYEKSIKAGAASLSDSIKIRDTILDNIQKEIEMQKALLTARKK